MLRIFKYFLGAVFLTFFMVFSASAAIYLTHGDSVDMERAMADLSVKANAGNAEAQFDLALHYLTGDGVDRDIQQSFVWLKKSADQNLANAQLYIAEFYAEGAVGEKDKGLALVYLKKAANQGLLEAQLGLANCYASSNEYKNELVGEQDFEAARYWFRKASEQGDSEAMYLMARTFESENVWEPDYRSAAKWLQRAVDAGSADAAYKLAHYYLDGDVGGENPEKATELFKKAALKGHEKSINQLVRNAENNDSNAQQFLAVLHSEYGQDTPDYQEYRQKKNQTFTTTSKANPTEDSIESIALLKKANDLYYGKSDAVASVSYYQQASDMGHLLAKSQLAKMLYLGAGVSENKEKAQEWFKEVLSQLESLAQQGDAFAQYLYGYYWDSGFGVSASSNKAFYWYQKSAEQGCAPAQNNLANQYKTGEGVTEDLGKAIHWYTQAAEQGNVTAQNNLASQYYYGTGVAKDYVEAAKWYEKAAEQGDAKSQYDLGYMYKNGEGVDQDSFDAAIWFENAAKQGHADAQYELGKQYFYGEGVPENNAKAFSWLSKASAQNDGHAQAILGLMYEGGYGVDKDYDIAEDYYKKAIVNGSTGAQKKLVALQEILKDEADQQYLMALVEARQREQQEQEEKDSETAEIAQRHIDSFRFPGARCSEPSFPSDFPSNSQIRRLNKKIDNFYSCINRSAKKDIKAIKGLIRQVGGSVDEGEDGFSWEVPNNCNCYDAITDFFYDMDSREQEREEILESVEISMDHLDRRIEKHNFWQGLSNSLR